MSTKKQDQPKELAAKDLAAKLGVDPKELRKWLRSEGLAAGGPGKRYAFTPQEAGRITSKWKKAQSKEETDAS